VGAAVVVTSLKKPWMEKIMTKTVQDRELQDSELDSVSAGESFGPVVQGMIDLINKPTPPEPTITPCGGRARNLRAA